MRRETFAFLLCGAATCTVAEPARAHDEFEADVTAGYRFGAGREVQASEGSVALDLEGGFAFGAMFGYRIEPEKFLYLAYARQQSTLGYESSASSLSTPMSVEYLHFGGNVQTTRGLFTPYLGVGLGPTRFAAYQRGNEQWYFSVSLDGGVKIEILDHLHARIVGRLPVTFVNGGTGVFCLRSSDCKVQFSAEPIVQAELQAGIGFSF